MASIAYKDGAGAVQELRLDSVEVTEINIGTQVTEHPVEEGAPVTDHVRVLLPVCTINGYVSNTPLPSNPGAQALFENREFDLPPATEKVPVSGNVDLPDPPYRSTAMVSVVRSAMGVVDSVFGLSGSGPKKMQGIVGVTEQAGPGRKMVGAVGLPGVDSNRAAAIFKKLEELQAKAELVTYVDSLRQYDDVVIENLTTSRSLEDGKGASFQLSLKRIRIVSAKRVKAPLPAEVRGEAPASKGSQSTQQDPNAGLKSGAAELVDQGYGLLRF